MAGLLLGNLEQAGIVQAGLRPQSVLMLCQVSLYCCSTCPACPSPRGPARSPAREPFQQQAQAGELGLRWPPL